MELRYVDPSSEQGFGCIQVEMKMDRTTELGPVSRTAKTQLLDTLCKASIDILLPNSVLLSKADALQQAQTNLALLESGINARIEQILTRYRFYKRLLQIYVPISCLALLILVLTPLVADCYLGLAPLIVLIIEAAFFGLPLAFLGFFSFVSFPWQGALVDFSGDPVPTVDMRDLLNKEFLEKSLEIPARLSWVEIAIDQAQLELPLAAAAKMKRLRDVFPSVTFRIHCSMKQHMYFFPPELCLRFAKGSGTLYFEVPPFIEVVHSADEHTASAFIYVWDERVVVKNQ